MEVVVNFWAVLAAMASSMIVGSIWYSQAVFGRQWARLAKVDMSKPGASPAKPITITMIVSLITAYVLAHVVYLSSRFFGTSFLESALTTAFWVWLGFTAARFITHDAFEGRPARLTAINLAHEFVTLMLMGLVIGLIGV